MPVSVTEKLPASPAALGLAETRISPDSVNLRAFEMKLRRICDTLPSSVLRTGSSFRLLKNQGDPIADQERLQHSAQSPEQIPNLKVCGVNLDLSRFHLGQIEKIVNQRRKIIRSREMNRTCFSCSDVKSPSMRARRRRERAMMELTGVRNSCVMLERNRDLSSSALRKWSAFSSSSAYRATTPRFVSSSSSFKRDKSSWRFRSSSSVRSNSWFCC